MEKAVRLICIEEFTDECCPRNPPIRPKKGEYYTVATQGSEQIIVEGNWDKVLTYVANNYDSNSVTSLELTGEFEYNGIYFYTE